MKYLSKSLAKTTASEITQDHYSAPLGRRGIVMSVSVCLCLCAYVSVRQQISGITCRNFTKFVVDVVVWIKEAVHNRQDGRRIFQL